MKSLFVPSLLFALALNAAAADAKKAASVNGRTVYHDNGTYTESVQDLSIREQNEVTYNAQNAVIAKKKYLLNEQGQPLQGNIYDGRGELKARAQFLYDEFGRMSEQRMYNLQGEIFQIISFPYDNNGKALTPKSRTFNVSTPDMKAGSIDFTNQRTAPRLDRSQGATPGQSGPQGNVPYLPEQAARPATSGPTAAPTGTNPQAGSTEGSKKSFFGKLFGGKKKEDKK